MDQFNFIARFFTDLEKLSHDGGWVFWALVLLAFAIALSMLNIWNSMNWRDTADLTGRQWKKLFKNWRAEPGLIEKLRTSMARVGTGGMEEIEQRLFAKARRRIPYAFVLIGTAPLVGLLGTVSGMMSSFEGMATASSTAPVETISRGISEALITTETGLIIGVPTFVVCTFLKSRFDLCVLNFRRIEAEVLKAI
jgi:biopolymer transport protein ExbB